MLKRTTTTTTTHYKFFVLNSRLQVPSRIFAFLHLKLPVIFRAFSLSLFPIMSHVSSPRVTRILHDRQFVRDFRVRSHAIDSVIRKSKIGEGEEEHRMQEIRLVSSLVFPQNFPRKNMFTSRSREPRSVLCKSIVNLHIYYGKNIAKVMIKIIL